MVKKYTYLEIFLPDLHRRPSLSEFQTHFKMPHQTIKNHLHPFLEAKILLLEQKGRFLCYALNLANPLLIDYLSICEKERLFCFLENPLFRQLHAHLNQFLSLRLHAQSHASSAT